MVDFFLCWVWFRDALRELVKSLEGRGDLVSKFRTPYCSREALCDCGVLARTSTSRTKHFYQPEAQARSSKVPQLVFLSATLSQAKRDSSLCGASIFAWAKESAFSSRAYE